MTSFPRHIRMFARLLVAMQAMRHEADYDPGRRLTRFEVHRQLERARETIDLFLGATAREQRDFSVYVLMDRRKD